MKKVTLVLAGALLLFALPSIPAYAEKCEDDGPFKHEDSDCKPKHIKVGEPGSFLLLATGLTALGGLAMLKRKKVANSR
jgi:hypothetical protein